MPSPFMSLPPEVESAFAVNRLGILRDTVRISAGSTTLDELLLPIIVASERRFEGVRGCIVLFDPAGVRLDFGTVAPPGISWPLLARKLDEAYERQRVAWQQLSFGADDDGSCLALDIDLDGPVVIIVPLPGVLAGDRALVFADPTGAVPFSRGILQSIVADSAYVLRREIERHRLLEREAQFRAVFDSSAIPQILMPQGDRRLMVVNDAMCKLVGSTRAELTGRTARTLTYWKDVPAVQAARTSAMVDGAGPQRVERRLVHASGALIPTESTIAWVEAGDGSHSLLVQFQDLTAQRSAEQRALFQAEIDSLTALPNRLHLVRAIAEMEGRGDEFGVLFLDVDAFKSINDARGHDIGDEVLIEVAGRLSDAIRPGDLAVRFGGDEFVILCRAEDGVTSLAARTRDLADRVQRLLVPPVETSSGPVHVTVSLGTCDDTVPVSRPMDRLQYADTAAYQAKRLGEDRQVVYDSGLHQQTVGYRRIEELLRTALSEDRFVLHYQPIVDIADGGTVAVEALIRMRDRDGSLVPPGDFISVAERSGLIVPMGAWVLAEACRTVADLGRMHGTDLRVSVNVSARQAARADLVDAVHGALSDTGLPPGALTLELTESALLEADAATLDRLNGLRSDGVRIALDDFGTGYSSLTYLRKLPVTTLKVDQSFVRSMTDDPANAAIVKAVTTLAADLGLTWVAEGVETEAEWQALRSLGSGLAQGFHFSRPLPIADLPAAIAGLAFRAPIEATG